MLNDPLANVLSNVLNYEQVGKREITLHPMSKTIRKTLQILNEKGYVGAIENITDARGGVVKLHLLGSINKCGAIKPRFAVKMDTYEKFEQRYLPAKGVGIIIVSTSKGIMTHEEAKEQNTGGTLLAYCY